MADSYEYNKEFQHDVTSVNTVKDQAAHLDFSHQSVSCSWIWKSDRVLGCFEASEHPTKSLGVSAKEVTATAERSTLTQAVVHLNPANNIAVLTQSKWFPRGMFLSDLPNKGYVLITNTPVRIHQASKKWVLWISLYWHTVNTYISNEVSCKDTDGGNPDCTRGVRCFGIIARLPPGVKSGNLRSSKIEDF